MGGCWLWGFGVLAFYENDLTQDNFLLNMRLVYLFFNAKRQSFSGLQELGT